MSVRDALRTLTSESAIYGFGQVAGKAVQLLLVPVLTRVLAPEAFGLMELLLAYASSLLLVLVFGMDAALARSFYEQPDAAARVRMVSSSLAFRVLTSALVTAALLAVSGVLAAYVAGGAVYAKYVRIAALGVPFTLLVLFANDVLRVTFQPWKFILLNVTQTVLVAGLTLALVLGRDLGVAGALYGKLGGDAAAALLGLVLCRHHIRPRFDRAILRGMLAYGVPLVPVAFAYGLIGGVDRWALQRSASLEQVAVYAIAAKFFAVLTMTVSAFQLAFGPFAFSRAQQPDAPKLFARVFALYVAVASGAALVVSLAAPWLVRALATERYAAAAAPAAWLAFAAVAQGAYYVAALGINLARRTALIGWTAGGGALVSLAGNLLLVPRWGASGAAIATCAAYLTSAVLVYAVAQHVHPLPYRGAKLLLMWSAALALTAAATRIGGGGVAGVGFGLLAVASYVALAWMLEPWSDRGAVRHQPGGPGSRSGG